jgi:hypothetical protein
LGGSAKTISSARGRFTSSCQITRQTNLRLQATRSSPSKFRESSPLAQLFDRHPVHGRRWFESDENRKCHQPKARSISESGTRHTIDDRSLGGFALGDFFDGPAGMLSGVGRGHRPRFLNRCIGRRCAAHQSSSAEIPRISTPASQTESKPGRSSSLRTWVLVAANFV